MRFFSKKTVKTIAGLLVLAVSLLGFFVPFIAFAFLFIIAMELLGFHILRGSWRNTFSDIREKENETRPKVG